MPDTKYQLLKHVDGMPTEVLATYPGGRQAKLYMPYERWCLLDYKMSLVGKVVTLEDLDRLLELALEASERDE